VRTVRPGSVIVARPLRTLQLHFRSNHSLTSAPPTPCQGSRDLQAGPSPPNMGSPQRGSESHSDGLVACPLTYDSQRPCRGFA
jgi:hypothetical protein